MSGEKPARTIISLFSSNAALTDSTADVLSKACPGFPIDFDCFTSEAGFPPLDIPAFTLTDPVSIPTHTPRTRRPIHDEPPTTVGSEPTIEEGPPIAQPPTSAPSPPQTQTESSTTVPLSSDSKTLAVISTTSFSGANPTEVPSAPRSNSANKTGTVFAMVGGAVAAIVLLLCIVTVVRRYLRRKAERKRFNDGALDHDEARLWADRERSMVEADTLKAPHELGASVVSPPFPGAYRPRVTFAD